MQKTKFKLFKPNTDFPQNSVNKLQVTPFPVACTQTLFYFSFCSFRNFFFPHHYPIALVVNKFLLFIFYHQHSTDFEEKIEGL